VIQPVAPDDPLGFGEMPAAVSDIMVATMRLKRMFDADSARILAAASGMREVDWRILYVLHAGGLLPQKEVMRVIQMEQAQASRALQRLKDTGKVRSIRDTEDRRSWKFGLTDEGRAELLAVLPAMERRRDEIDAVLSDEEMSQLRRLMTKVARSLVTPDGAKTWDRTRSAGSRSAGMADTQVRRNG